MRRGSARATHAGRAHPVVLGEGRALGEEVSHHDDGHPAVEPSLHRLGALPDLPVALGNPLDAGGAVFFRIQTHRRADVALPDEGHAHDELGFARLIAEKRRLLIVVRITGPPRVGRAGGGEARRMRYSCVRPRCSALFIFDDTDSC